MRSVTVASALLIITACQRTPEEQAPAINEGAQKAAPVAVWLLPGEYESRIISFHRKFEPVETPQGKLTLGDDIQRPPPLSNVCVTADPATQPFRQYRAPDEVGRNCSRASFTKSDGRIRGSLVCTEGGEKSERQLDGRYTPTGYDVTEVIKTQTTIPPGNEIAPTSVPTTVTKQMTARRIGDCPAK